MRKSIIIGLIASYIAVLGAISTCGTKDENYGLGKLVNVPVTIKSNNFWDIRNQEDADGDKLMSENVPGWQNLLSDLSIVNQRGESESLADVIKRNRYVTLPEQYVNSAYDFDRGKYPGD